MSAFKDRTGQVFGRLTVLRCVGRTKASKAIWLCLCDCGKEIEVVSGSLASGGTQSCGCLHDEMAAGRLAVMRPTQRGEHNPNFKHGHSRRSPEYQSWASMVTRCTNPSRKDWFHYGGALAPVLCCDRWLNSFESFLADLGERPIGTSLGRFGDVGNYEPGNCAWQTKREQVAEQKMKRQLQFVAA